VQIDMKVSVVIPLYNKAAYIARTLDSVLAQTWTDFDVMVVDDGSTDESPEIVRRYRDPRVRLITQENRGSSAARNRGVAQSRADWIAMLDADDEWLPQFLQRMLEASHAHPDAAVLFANGDPVLAKAPCLQRKGELLFVPDFFEFYTYFGGAMMGPSAMMVHRQALLDIDGFAEEARYGEDIDAWARLAWRGHPLYCLPETLAIYHEDVPGRKCNDPRHFLQAPKQIIATCYRWQQEGRIPRALQQSTLRFLHTLLLQKAYLLTDVNERSTARGVLRHECDWRICGRAAWLKCYLRACIPASLLRSYRWLKARSGKQASPLLGSRPGETCG
jgi:glycosyltransferase involved in cell wall biosynthesis